MTRRFTLFSLCCALFLTMTLASCQKFKGSQTVPAYIHIESISLECDYDTYGANSTNITDAWVFVDDQIIGCFELPATFPVLQKGKHKVSVYGGICVDGIGATRSYNIFYMPKEYEGLNLVEDSIINLNPVVTYYPIGEGVNLAWKEDFETSNSLVATTDSDTSLIRMHGSEAWQSNNSFYSGEIVLPPDSLDFTVATSEELDFYSGLNGIYSILEMDYKCNDDFFVGVMYFKGGKLTKHPLLQVVPTDTLNEKPQRWNKIYVNIGPIINANDDATYFKLYFTSDLSANADYGEPEYVPLNKQRYFYFDNLKLLYRQQ